MKVLLEPIENAGQTVVAEDGHPIRVAVAANREKFMAELLSTIHK